MQYSKYIGHENQISGVEEVRLVEGRGNNMRLFQARNGQGLECAISVDRCADIYRVTFKGYNIGYFAPCGWVAPTYYNCENQNSWLPTFTGGFLTTCGLENAGIPCNDDGEVLPQHGTIANTPAEHAFWCREKDALVIEADIRDAQLFKRKLILHRNIRISTVENKITVTDTVENLGHETSPVMMMYHMNMGYPLLSENSIVDIPSDAVVARDARAAEDLDTHLKILKPTAGFEEQCYFHSFNDIGKAKIFNPEIGVGLSISYDAKNLPCLTEWKMMGEHDYVLGLEPGNCTPMGRENLRKDGNLQFVNPGESVTFTFDVDFFNDINSWELA